MSPAEPDRYAVFGHPIGHSKSPRIHALFAAQTGQRLSYMAIDVPPERFAAELAAFHASGGRGLNCTIPLKELAFHAVTRRSSRAMRAGAVNTLWWQDDGALYGDNTDGAGLVHDLRHNLSLELSGTHILLLGAGGAVRGVLEPLLRAAPAEICIANRTAGRAARLAGEFADLGPLQGGGFDALAGLSFDLILNATAASLVGELPPLPTGVLRPGGVCYDLAYGPTPTPFVQWGLAHGARLSVDGIGMLVEQAAEAFALWRGMRPATIPVIQALRQERGW